MPLPEAKQNRPNPNRICALMKMVYGLKLPYLSLTVLKQSV